MKTLTILLLSLMAVSLHAADRTTPREIQTPYPTLTNLAVEWQIDGDDKLDATCEVKFRKAGEVTWHNGMPLRRVPAGTSQKTNPIVSWTNRLSGSIFDLEPGTEYQIALKLHDPDRGDATKTVKASTRPEPVAAADAVTRNGSKADLNSVKPGEGIQITGSGNVIRHNHVSGFRDCLSHMEDDGAAPQMRNDWLNNDISVGLDDGIEADFAMSDCRVIRNRITNCFVGISSQPGLGGPNYFIRNVMFNFTYSAFKLHRYSMGDVILHNTIVKSGDGFGNYTSEPFDHALIQSNLFIGGKAHDAKYGGYSPGRGRAADVQQFGDHCVFDYNAYAVNGVPFEGKFRSWTFTKLPGTDYEPHGVQLGMDVLAVMTFPEDPTLVYSSPDLRPRKDSAVVDAAIRIPNVNDNFAGQQPDIGAYETGQVLPIYGPRQ